MKPMPKYKAGPTGIKINVIASSQPPEPKMSGNIKAKVKAALSRVVMATPTGVNLKEGRTHTVEDAVNKKKKKK